MSYDEDLDDMNELNILLFHGPHLTRKESGTETEETNTSRTVTTHKPVRYTTNKP